MSLRPTSATTRLGILAAGGALAALTLTGPAFAAGDTDANGHPRVYKGRVTAKHGLLLRTSPHRGAKVIRSVPYGKVVSIYCKTTGDHVSGNNRWYLLTNGTWAWGAAHYIANIGPAPRWC
ncbi:SH3 domain-containing protein [Streptomyces sp. BA2]|uniref:SH3 domain-containing protein n=1 Tax=Streptomyces sp. BA2 TaxID=436595 RepID=UPI001324893B|nr:SH3 domain-containing protein [Streptomyces sp. BA2]MWA13610.1 SH3 domain-containing protein [Streptomyces sp. BA2]